MTLRTDLEDIRRQPIDQKIEDYENLVENRNVEAVEKVEEVTFEIRRRIDLIRQLSESLGMEDIAERSSDLLEKL